MDYIITVLKSNGGYAGPDTVKTIRLTDVSEEYLEAFVDGVKACYPKHYNVYKEKL